MLKPYIQKFTQYFTYIKKKFIKRQQIIPKVKSKQFWGTAK